MVILQHPCIMFLLISTNFSTFNSPTPLWEAGPIPFEQAHNYILSRIGLSYYWTGHLSFYILLLLRKVFMSGDKLFDFIAHLLEMAGYTTSHLVAINHSQMYIDQFSPKPVQMINKLLFMRNIAWESFMGLNFRLKNLSCIFNLIIN